MNTIKHIPFLWMFSFILPFLVLRGDDGGGGGDGGGDGGGGDGGDGGGGSEGGGDNGGETGRGEGGFSGGFGGGDTSSASSSGDMGGGFTGFGSFSGFGDTSLTAGFAGLSVGDNAEPNATALTGMNAGDPLSGVTYGPSGEVVGITVNVEGPGQDSDPAPKTGDAWSAGTTPGTALGAGESSDAVSKAIASIKSAYSAGASSADAYAAGISAAGGEAATAEDVAAIKNYSDKYAASLEAAKALAAKWGGVLGQVGAFASSQQTAAGDMSPVAGALNTSSEGQINTTVAQVKAAMDKLLSGDVMSSDPGQMEALNQLIARFGVGQVTAAYASGYMPTQMQQAVKALAGKAFSGMGSLSGFLNGLASLSSLGADNLASILNMGRITGALDTKDKALASVVGKLGGMAVPGAGRAVTEGVKAITMGIKGLPGNEALSPTTLPNALRGMTPTGRYGTETTPASPAPAETAPTGETQQAPAVAETTPPAVAEVVSNILSPEMTYAPPQVNYSPSVVGAIPTLGNTVPSGDINDIIKAVATPVVTPPAPVAQEVPTPQVSIGNLLSSLVPGRYSGAWDTGDKPQTGMGGNVQEELRKILGL